MANSDPTSVVFDVHVFVNALIGAGSTYPLISSVPPSTSNTAADCLSIAFDAEEFRLYASPHILANTARVLKASGLGSNVVERYVQALLEIVAETGGKVVEPPRAVFDVKDYEDNLILDLVVAVDALILVSDDTDLTSLSPWNGRLITRPRGFVERVLQSRRLHRLG
jgi:putative PIN family toxin of toxin-antitoxin system